MPTNKEAARLRVAKLLEGNPNYFKDMSARSHARKKELGIPEGYAAMTPEKRIEYGRKGGQKSKRP